MKTHNFIRLTLYFIISSTILSCSLDEVNYPNAASKVSFVNLSHTMTQEMESISIPLKLDIKAINDGYLTIELSGDAIYGSDFTTLPEAENNKIRIKLLTNTKDTSFVVLRANTITSEKFINLKLSNTTNGFSIGNRNTSEVKLNAQQINVNQLNFDASVGAISEGNLEGLVIGLNATGSVPNGTRARVKITMPDGIAYGTHFYTVPAATSNEIELEFNQNAQSTNFKIIPINDSWALENYNIVFELIYVTVGFEIGEQKEFTVGILDDDQTSGVINTIAELRSKFDQHQGDWYIPEDYLIEGVITSNGNTLDNKSVYIQDATSGILIRFNTPNIFNLGDKIRLNLKNGTANNFNYQKAIDGVNISGYAKYAENVPVEAEAITIDQLHSGDFEGKRVRIDNVHFDAADGVIKFLGNNTIRYVDSGAIVTVYATANFSDYVLPQGTISIIGIVGDFGRLLPQKYTHDIIN